MKTIISLNSYHFNYGNWNYAITSIEVIIYKLYTKIAKGDALFDIDSIK